MAGIGKEVYRMIVVKGTLYNGEGKSFDSMVALLEKEGFKLVDKNKGSTIYTYEWPDTEYPEDISIITFDNNGSLSMANNYKVR